MELQYNTFLYPQEKDFIPIPIPLKIIESFYFLIPF